MYNHISLRDSPGWLRADDEYMGEMAGLHDSYVFTKIDDGMEGMPVTFVVAAPMTDENEDPTPDRHWKVCAESIRLCDVPLGEISDIFDGLGCTNFADFKNHWVGTYYDNSTRTAQIRLKWQHSLCEYIFRNHVCDGSVEWMECPSPEAARRLLDMIGIRVPRWAFDHLDPASPECERPAAREAYLKSVGADEPGAGEDSLETATAEAIERPAERADCGAPNL